ncbi:MAG: hypothetical protein IPG52_12295 [Rhodocyclaceae bacterium]|nr:hypothetical protein [Rhodocyclaceae bacterium]
MAVKCRNSSGDCVEELRRYPDDFFDSIIAIAAPMPIVVSTLMAASNLNNM